VCKTTGRISPHQPQNKEQTMDGALAILAFGVAFALILFAANRSK
jgi:hypothetical protein